MPAVLCSKPDGRRGGRPAWTAPLVPVQRGGAGGEGLLFDICALRDRLNKSCIFGKEDLLVLAVQGCGLLKPASCWGPRRGQATRCAAPAAPAAPAELYVRCVPGHPTVQVGKLRLQWVTYQPIQPVLREGVGAGLSGCREGDHCAGGEGARGVHLRVRPGCPPKYHTTGPRVSSSLTPAKCGLANAVGTPVSTPPLLPSPPWNGEGRHG